MKEKLKKIGLGYKDFINRGNIIELAVAMVIGMLFNDIVKKFVEAFITPIIVIATGKIALTDLSFKIAGVYFPYGLFIQSVVNFLIVSLIIYLIFVKVVNEKIKLLQPKTLEETDNNPSEKDLLIRQNELLTLLVKNQIPNYQQELEALQKEKNGVITN